MRITGKVESDAGIPIQGASIALKDSGGVPVNAGSLSDADGYFSVTTSLINFNRLYFLIDATGYLPVIYKPSMPVQEGGHLIILKAKEDENMGNDH